jgi:hypothetical protein
MHDPFQAYATLGAYPGAPTPFMGQPNYPQSLASLNPLAAQQQLASILGAQNPYGIGQNPIYGMLQNPLQQNPLLQNPLLQNPWAIGLQTPQIHPLVAQALGLHHGLHNPLLQQQGGIGVSPFGQHPGYGQQAGYGQQVGYGSSPFGQIGSPFGQTGYPLAPQSWIGQPGLMAQIHPLYQQLAARAFATPGIQAGACF